MGKRADSSRRSGAHGRKSGTDRWNLTGWIVSAIQLVLTIVFLVLLYRFRVLPVIFMAVIAAVLIILLVVFRLLMGKAKKKVRFLVGMILSLILSVSLCIGNIALYHVNSTLHEITDSEYETTQIGVYVLTDDPAQSVQEASWYTFGIMSQQGRKDTNNAIEQIEDELGTTIASAEFDDATALAQGLLDQKCQAIILNEAFVDVIAETEGYEDFGNQIREIGTYQWKRMVSKQTETKSDEEGSVFTVYISGIDVSGDISKRSRSDVNILAVVNTNTHKMQLISTPRDYYVPLSISDGVKDKLTHAGIYGVDVSMDTLGMLYDIDIDYYFRVNFSGFEQLINALGGITVYSDYEFDAGGYHYTMGDNTLNGTQALAFARERHSFAEGDRQRGRNQMAVITAVVEKMQTTAVLQDFSGLMEGLQGSFDSDIPYDLLADMVKDQLSGGEKWSVSTYSVDGTGTSASTYSMSSKAYVMEPDMSTVEEAKKLIEEAKK